MHRACCLFTSLETSCTFRKQQLNDSNLDACRDYSDSPTGIIYELAGESVIPGIDCKTMGSIFEEHTICNELDAASAQRNVFALSERRFDFGAVLAAVGSSSPQPGVKANLQFTNVFKVGSYT